MKLNEQQLAHLSKLVGEVTERDTLGCDGCFELMDQFADAVMEGTPLSPTLVAVEVHLTQCRCCRDEYEALITALHAISDR